MILYVNIQNVFRFEQLSTNVTVESPCIRMCMQHMYLQVPFRFEQFTTFTACKSFIICMNAHVVVQVSFSFIRSATGWADVWPVRAVVCFMVLKASF